jgi:hypothetical protein
MGTTKQTSARAIVAALAFLLPLGWGCGGGHGTAGPDGGGGIGGGGGGGSGHDGGADAGGAIPLDQLCDAYTTALCTAFTQCGSNSFRDMDHCRAETECFGVRTLMSQVAAGAVAYDATKAGACQARFLADPCNFAFFITWPEVYQVFAECPGTLTPMRHAGDPCDETGECTSDSYCKKSGYVCPGICTPFVKVGDTCASGAGATPCAPGTECLDGACRLPRKAGDACASSGGCGWAIETCPNGRPNCAEPNNLWCDLGGTGTCQPGVGLGATCGTVTRSGATTTIGCDSTLWCDAFLNQSGTCRAAGGAGAPCSQFNCQPGFHCVGDFDVGPSATLGTCVPPVALGDACGVDSDCASGLVCGVQGTCATPAGLNEACSSDSSCQAGLFCTDSYVCLAARYPGDPCGDADSACAHGICRAGTCVDHAKAGQPCAGVTDCVTADMCRNGACADTYVCDN